MKSILRRCNVPRFQTLKEWYSFLCLMKPSSFLLPALLLALAACAPTDRDDVGGAASSSSAAERFVSAECQVGGCSGQICQGIDEEPAVSDCMYRPAYECYKTGRCERQADGRCGWTMTPELSACLMDPPEDDSSVSA